MNTLLKNNKGVVLIVAYVVLVGLLGLSAVAFLRSITEARAAQRASDSLQAFYNAEAGIAYAHAEARTANFIWYTHVDNDRGATPANVATFNAELIAEFGQGTGQAIFNATGLTSSYDATALVPLRGNIDSVTCLYTVGGKNFQVKSYPEIDWTNGSFTGAVIILSQATVNNVTRTVESRLGQSSAYGYFFFYPDNHVFEYGTYDGYNFGAIHVNGDIIFRRRPEFKYLTALTCGSNEPSKGYIRQYRWASYPDYQGEINYPSTILNPNTLGYWMYHNVPWQYTHGWSGDGMYTRFTSGPVNPADGPSITKDLPYYLEQSDPGWDYDKYAGNPGANPAAHWNLEYAEDHVYQPLYDLAVHEEILENRSPTIDYYNLLDETQNIDVTLNGTHSGTYIEKTAFKTAYQAEQAGDTVDWNSFWTLWKANHANEYYGDNKDWERRFFQACHNWAGGAGTPSNINHEWWVDMEYGSDRKDGSDLEPAQDEDSFGTLVANQYFLNTEEQATAFGNWLEANDLDEYADDKTLIQDRSRGAGEVDTGQITSLYDQSAYDKFKQQAKSGGIYIGIDINGGLLEADLNEDGEVDADDLTIFFTEENQTGYGLSDLNYDGLINGDDFTILFQQLGSATFEIANPIASCTEVKSFYNVKHPNISGSVYVPSDILQIDVHALKDYIEKPVSEGGMGGNFNGIIYVDLKTGFFDPSLGASEYNIINDDYGVMLVNGEALPDGGLSIITNNNVFVKGNYNLDPDGHKNDEDVPIGRGADDSDVLTRVVYDKYGGGIALKWQPAEIISTRAVYTLSENFPEWQYMAMNFDHNKQYEDERDGYVPSQAGCNDYYYPEANWVPNVAATRTHSSYGPNIEKWFTHYFLKHTGPGDIYEGETIPANWTRSWVDKHWPSDANKIFPLDTDAPGDSGYGEPDTYIASNNLRTAVYDHIENRYDNTFSYPAIHGSDPANPLNVNTPSRFNIVTDKHIYNTAIVTPHDTSPYVLEYWSTTDRVINGAFIQLPWAFHDEIDDPARNNRVDDPDQFFNYETRFGRGAEAGQTPKANLLFSAGSSWREIKNEHF